MNIEYEVTTEDDLAQRQTNWNLWLKSGKVLFIPARYFTLYLCAGSISLIIWGFFEPVQSDRQLLWFSGGFGLLIGFILSFVYKPKRLPTFSDSKALQKENSDYYAKKDIRKIILTEKEFIFETSNSKTAWSWTAFKSFREDVNGFMFYFYSGDSKFVSKKVFTNEQELNDFKDTIRYLKNSQPNE